MAISKDFYTLLPLDSYCEFVGLNPVHFNGGVGITLASGRRIYPIRNSTQDLWSQKPYYNENAISRDDIARAIKDAENLITDFIGYFPAPNWVEEEEHSFPSYYRKELGRRSYNVRGNRVSFIPKKARFISGGRKNTSLIEEEVAITYEDNDGDGWDEVGKIEVDILDGSIPLFEIKAFFPGNSGNKHYEIRPPKSITIDGTVVTIYFHTWQLVKLSKWYEVPSDGEGGRGIDFSDSDNLITSVDIYRVYNDTTQNHFLFIRNESRYRAESENDGGFLSVSENYRRVKGKAVMPIIATYDEDSSEWQKQSLTYTPDRIKLWYYSGAQENSVSHGMPNDFVKCVCELATALLSKSFLGGNQINSYINYLMEDLSVARDNEYRLTNPDIITNPFGPERGAYRTYKFLEKLRHRKR